MNIALAADHAGYALKTHLLEFLRQQGFTVADLGVDTGEVPSDYPDMAVWVGDALKAGTAERGILVCGSGVGVSIAANKIEGIYAGMCHDTYSAHQGVEHDRMNVLCLGARIIGSSLAEELCMAFLRAQPSDEERFVRRFNKLLAIEERSNE